MIDLNNIELLKKSKKEIQYKSHEDGLKFIDNGDVNDLKMYLWLKSAIEYMSVFMNTIHDSAMKEFDLYSEKEVLVYGRKVSKFEAGSKYDFSKCGHPDIQKWEKVLKKNKDHLDQLYKEIQILKDKKSFFDEESGEVFVVTPPIKTSTTKLKIS